MFEIGFGVGFCGPLWAMQAAFAPMQAQGRGNVINLCSLNGVNAHMGTAEYNSAKEAPALLGVRPPRQVATLDVQAAQRPLSSPARVG